MINLLNTFSFNHSCQGSGLPEMSLDPRDTSIEAGEWGKAVKKEESVVHQTTHFVYGLGQGLGRIINTITEASKAMFTRSQISTEEQPKSARLTTYFGDGHGMVRLNCQSCGLNGEAVHRTYSFYPDTHKKGEVLTDVQSILADVESTLIGSKGIAIQERPYKLDRRDFYGRRISVVEHTYRIGEQEAARVHDFVSAPHRYHFFGVVGYNCVDFAQKAYEEAGLEGHFAKDLEYGNHVGPDFWGWGPPLHMAVYESTHPYHPETVATISLVALFVLRWFKRRV